MVSSDKEYMLNIISSTFWAYMHRGTKIKMERAGFVVEIKQ